MTADRGSPAPAGEPSYGAPFDPSTLTAKTDTRDFLAKSMGAMHRR